MTPVPATYIDSVTESPEGKLRLDLMLAGEARLFSAEQYDA